MGKISFLNSIFQLYRNAYSGLSKNIWLLALVMLINRSGTMVIAFLTLYVTQHLHLTPKHAGTTIAVYGAGAILGAFLGGKLSDKFGYKIIQEVALIGGGIMFILISFVTNFHLFCFLIFILASVNESFRPANTSAVAANCQPENRTRSFALLRLAMNLGWSVGTTLGGIISHYNYSWLFLIDGTTSIFAGISLLFIKFKVVTPNENHLENEVSTDLKPLRNKAFMFFVSGTLLFTFSFFQLFTNLPLFYKVGLKLDERIIGLIMALNGLLIAFTEMVLVKNLEKRFPIKNIIIFGTLLISLFFLINAGYTHLFPLVVGIGGMLLVTVAEMLSLPFMNSHFLSYAGKKNTGGYAAIYTITWSLGQILAGFIGGNIINSYGFSPLWILCAVLTLICAFIYRKVID